MDAWVFVASLALASATYGLYRIVAALLVSEKIE
jgi:hypothetical protein